ncbi:hypothetical protein ACS0TY_031053 [Phlomoides rotata]
MALKILRSLPERWDIFTTMFQNTKYLSSISSEQLFSEFRAHEFDLNRRRSIVTEPEPEEPSVSTKGVAFKAKQKNVQLLQERFMIYQRMKCLRK